MRKLFLILITLGALLVILAGVFLFYYYPVKMQPAREYRGAAALSEQGDHVSAALRFESLGSLMDSEVKAREEWVKAGDAAYEAGELARARTYYLKGGAGAEALGRLDAAYYKQGVQAYAENDRATAENCFFCISAGSRYLALLDQARLGCAKRLLNTGDLAGSEKVFSVCTRDSYPEICSLWYEYGRAKVALKDIESASYCFTRAVAYSVDEAATLESIRTVWASAAQKAEASGDWDFAAKCRERMGI